MNARDVVVGLHLYSGSTDHTHPCLKCGDPARSQNHISNNGIPCDVIGGPCSCGEDHDRHDPVRREFDRARASAPWVAFHGDVRCPTCHGRLLAKSYRPVDTYQQTWTEFKCPVCVVEVGRIGYTDEARGLVTGEWMQKELARQVKESRKRIDPAEAITPADGSPLRRPIDEIVAFKDYANPVRIVVERLTHGGEIYATCLDYCLCLGPFDSENAALDVMRDKLREMFNDAVKRGVYPPLQARGSTGSLGRVFEASKRGERERMTIRGITEPLTLLVRRADD